MTRALIAMAGILVLTWGSRWGLAAVQISMDASKVREAKADKSRVQQRLDEFRNQKTEEPPIARVDMSSIFQLLNLDEAKKANLERTLDTMPFVMNCSSAQVWLNSRMGFHEGEAIDWPTGSPEDGSDFMPLMQNAIEGLDIRLSLDCTEFPCFVTLETEVIPQAVLKQFYQEVDFEYETMIFDQAHCEQCPNQHLSFGVSAMQIPDEAFRRMRWRKGFGGVL